MPRKLLDQVRDIIPVKHYSYRTEKSYVIAVIRQMSRVSGVYQLVVKLLYGSGVGSV
jgi:hypothetical protein